MATEYVADPSGLDGLTPGVGDWDGAAVGMYLAATLLGAPAGGAAKLGGVVPAVGTPLKYVVSSGLIGTLKAGVYLMPAVDAVHGVHPIYLPADVNFTHTTANATNPRTDLIIAEMADLGTASSFKKFRILTGTAGVGAPTPTNPTSLGNGGWASLASVNIPASGGAGAIGTITDLRTFTVAAGGVWPRIGAVAGGAGGLLVPDGTVVWDSNANLGRGSLVTKEAGALKEWPSGVLPYTSGSENINTSAGFSTINHGLGRTPVAVIATPLFPSSVEAVLHLATGAYTSTTFQVKYYRTDQSGILAAADLKFTWIAV